MLKDLTIDDLPQSLKDIADVIGIDSLKDLIKLAGGTSLYIPSEINIVKPVRNKKIKESFKGDYKEISRKFNITEVQVRNIIKSS